MEKASKRRINRPRFAVDINTSYKILKKTLGGWAIFKSIKELTGDPETKDPDILTICNKENYHVITSNTAHFKKYVRDKKNKIEIGVICINLQQAPASAHRFVNSVGVLIKKRKHDYFNNKFI